MLTAAALLLSVPAVAGAGEAKATGPPPLVTRTLTFRTSDGTVLHATVGGFRSLARRPVIVEDSPYAPDVSSLGWVGSDFNFLELQWRGTGRSEGSLDATGPADQRDLSQFLGWACSQPWSDGRTGLYGFSASAIVVYNAMHLPLPCVKAAALMAGTTDLYRDLLYIGGIPNSAAGAYVEAAIGGPTVQSSPDRAQHDPGSGPAAAAGFVTTPGQVAAHPTEDAYWQERTFRGDPGHIPVLAETSFYDVEPDGPFAAFTATRTYGSHLVVCGAHDGVPAGRAGPFPLFANWFEHYLRGGSLSAANQPVVSVCAGKGSRQRFLAGAITTLTGSSWPLTGTSWQTLYLSPLANPSVPSVNSGSLAARPAPHAAQAYPFVPSEATETDLHNVGVVGPAGLDQAARTAPGLTDMQLSGSSALTYTTPPLTRPLTAVGPGSLDAFLSSTAPLTDIYAVVADVWPDGVAYPVATGALRTAYPGVDRSRSLLDAHGDVVEPWNVYSSQNLAAPGTTREYHVEILPMGNTFGVGHAIRLYLVGTPGDQMGAPPGANLVSIGGATPSRLLLPSVSGPARFGGRP